MCHYKTGRQVGCCRSVEVSSDWYEIEAIRGKGKGQKQSASAPTLQNTIQRLQVKDAMASKNKIKSKGSRVCQIGTGGHPIATPAHIDQDGYSGFEDVLWQKNLPFPSFAKGRVLVGRSSDRIAMVDHPEPPMESVPFNPVVDKRR